MSSVLICDDSPLAREALRRVVSGLPDVDRVGTAGSGEEVLSRYPVERPDLVLMDVRMPGIGGVVATRRLLASFPQARVVMLVLPDDLDAAAKSMASGAVGFLVKDASPDEVAVVVGHGVADSVNGHRRPTRDSSGRPVLTEREMQVLAGMSRGRSNGEIGRDLYLSEDTVKTHARRLFRKLGASDRAHAVAIGFRWGVVR